MGPLPTCMEPVATRAGLALTHMGPMPIHSIRIPRLLKQLQK